MPEEQATQHKVYTSNLHCPLCGKLTLRVDPAMHTWVYYCPACECMVVPQELEDNGLLPDGAVGRVVAWQKRLKIMPADDKAVN